MLSWISELWGSGTLGGASFVEFVTALNIATASWDQFQEKLQTLERKCKESVSDNFLETIDQVEEAALSLINRTVLKAVNWLNGYLWKTCNWLAIAAVFAGIFMLYSNLYCRWDFLLLAPNIIYLGITTLSLIVVKITVKSARKALEIIRSSKPSDAELNEIRSSLDTISGNRETVAQPSHSDGVSGGKP